MRFRLSQPLGARGRCESPIRTKFNHFGELCAKNSHRTTFLPSICGSVPALAFLLSPRLGRPNRSYLCPPHSRRNKDARRAAPVQPCIYIPIYIILHSRIPGDGGPPPPPIAERTPKTNLGGFPNRPDVTKNVPKRPRMAPRHAARNRQDVSRHAQIPTRRPETPPGPLWDASGTPPVTSRPPKVCIFI